VAAYAAQRGGAAGIDSDRARFLRSLKRGLRQVPVSGVGEGLGRRDFEGLEHFFKCSKPIVSTTMLVPNRDDLLPLRLNRPQALLRLDVLERVVREGFVRGAGILFDVNLVRMLRLMILGRVVLLGMSTVFVRCFVVLSLFTLHLARVFGPLV